MRSCKEGGGGGEDGGGTEGSGRGGGGESGGSIILMCITFAGVCFFGMTHMELSLGSFLQSRI